MNCGCPQHIAKRGHYGAFLLDEPDLIVRIVQCLTATLPIPVSVKIRIQPCLEDTLKLAKRLEAAGCVMLTVHGRTREEKCSVAANWEAIAAVKRALSIPVVANGGIECFEDIDECLRATGADAVMISEAALENPAIFSGRPLTRGGQIESAEEYIRFARRHPPLSPGTAKSHLFKILFIATNACPNLRNTLGQSFSLEEVLRAGEVICEQERENLAQDPELFERRCDTGEGPFTTWYRRHRRRVSSAGNEGAAESVSAPAPAPGVEG